MDEFYQRKLFLKKRFIFTDKGIEIEFKDNDGDFSLFVPFDKVGPRTDIRVFTRKKKTILRLGLALTALTLFKGIISIGTDQRAFFAATATAAIVAVIFYGYYYFTSLKYYAVPLTTGKHFQVIGDAPSAHEVDEFMDELYQRRNDYLRGKHFFINYDNDAEGELNRMQWLFDEGIISAGEFEVAASKINESINE